MMTREPVTHLGDRGEYVNSIDADDHLVHLFHLCGRATIVIAMTCVFVLWHVCYDVCGGMCIVTCVVTCLS